MLGSTTLSPSRALTGMVTRLAVPKLLMSSRKSDSILR